VICPYCQLNIQPTAPPSPLGRGMGSSTRIWYSDEKGRHEVRDAVCPACHRTFLIHSDQIEIPSPVPGEVSIDFVNDWVIHPRVPARGRAAAEVPEPYASLFNEAALTLLDSPRGSAMLSRRALQDLLRDEAHAPDLNNLYAEIQWVIDNVALPSHIADTLHEPRIVGNMGAHPTKAPAGDRIEVVAGEAEWMLDVLDALFDFYFIAPAKTAARKAALQQRLGKS
jgi:Domain of unknown function (DUF4145)